MKFLQFLFVLPVAWGFSLLAHRFGNMIWTVWMTFIIAEALSCVVATVFMKKIITISREFGSGGRFIGEKLAGRLGFAFYDREIIEKVAVETGLSEKYISRRGEYAPKNSIFSYSFVGRDTQG